MTGHLAFCQKELYRQEHDDMTYYFGLTLSYNTSYLKTTKSTKFLASDSVMVTEPGPSGGVALGLMGTLRLDDHFQFRVNPQLIIGGSKFISYTLDPATTKPGEAAFQKQVLPSNIVSFPFQIKFNSDRIGNFRTYMLGGIKYDIDLASNSAARNAEDIIKLKRYDFGIEAGIGFNFYLPFVTVSPELKISNGLSNIHQLDPALKYSNVLDKIQSRMIVFSIHFED
jgi:Outer membrane protein beta-barrel domain